MFIDEKTVYGENIKELTKKLLELISNYSKVAGYKVFSQKPNPSLFTSNKQVEFKIKNTILPLSLVPPLWLLGTWSCLHPALETASHPARPGASARLLWAPAPYHGGAVVIVFVIRLPGLEAAPAESMIAFGTGHAVEEASWSGFLPLARAPPGIPRAWTHRWPFPCPLKS